MESLAIRIDGPGYDEAVHGSDKRKTVRQAGPVEMIAKPKATVGGKAGVVITFPVELPDGTIVYAQAVTTLALIESAGAVARGWVSGGHV